MIWVNVRSQRIECVVPGTANLQPLGVAGQAAHFTLVASSGNRNDSKAPTSVSLFDQGLTQVVRASAEAAAGAAQSDKDKQLADRMVAQSKFHQLAREFGRIASERGGAFAPKNRWRDNVIATGGGPGIVEAANRGASDVDAPSIGFNISLPHEQQPNPYITAELNFRFHYFAMRKMHFAMRANALAIFPGGFGTMDEMFEMLTLQQTRKAPPSPIVLFGKSYWSRIINFEALAEEGVISPSDLQLFEFADTAEEGWASLVRRGLLAHAGRT